MLAQPSTPKTRRRVMPIPGADGAMFLAHGLGAISGSPLPRGARCQAGFSSVQLH